MIFFMLPDTVANGGNNKKFQPEISRISTTEEIS